MLVVVGSANLDTLIDVVRLPRTGETVSAGATSHAAGGKGLNQAVAAARQQAAVRFVGCVGDDPAATMLRSALERTGVDTTALLTVPDHPTGSAMVTVAEDGTNTVVVTAGANGQLTAADVDATFDGLPAAPRVVLVQLETPHAAVRRVLERGRAVEAITVLNPAPVSGPLPDGTLGLVDVLVPNQTEAAALVGESASPESAATQLRAAGCRAVIVTLGERGAIKATEAGISRVDPFSVNTVDTTAAGDAFCGTLAAELAGGHELAVAARRACAAGALATTVAGAEPSLPSRTAVDRLLSGGSAAPLPPVGRQADARARVPSLWDDLVHSRRHGPLPLGLLTLTVVTGMVDAVCFLALGRVFAANMTGNVVFLGFALAGATGFSVARSVLAVVSFVAGAFTAGLLADRLDVGGSASLSELSGRARLLAVSSTIELVTTGGVTILLANVGDRPSTRWAELSLVMLAGGFGSRNAFVGRIGVPGMSPNVLTTTITGLGFELSRPDRHWSTLRLRVAVIVTMFSGAVLGATLVINVASWVAMALAAAMVAITAAAVWMLWRRGVSQAEGKLEQ